MNTVAFNKLKVVVDQYKEYKKIAGDLENLKQQYNENQSSNSLFLRSKIEELAQELSKYNQSDISVIETVLVLNKKISVQAAVIQKIEEESINSNDSKVIVLDAKGQKKYIAISLENEYSSKVNEQRDLLEKYNSLVKKILNIDIVCDEKDESDDLNKELKNIDEQIQKIITVNSSGKKELLPIEGKMVMFPIAYYGIYQNLKRRKQELLKSLNRAVAIDVNEDKAEIVDSFSMGEVIIKRSDGIKKLKEKMYGKLKHVGYCAAVALFAGTVLMASLLPNKSISIADNKVSAANQVEQVDSTDIISEDDIDSIVLKDTARIYRDSYSSVNQKNSYKPYYTNQTKNVAGVTFVKDGKLLTIYKNDPEFNQKYHTLLEQNASIRSYLTAVDGSYEGYYNVQDVKGKQR